MSELWTPDGVEYIQTWELGRVPDTGLRAYQHEFKLSYKGETEFFSVVGEEDTSEAQIEDMAAKTAEGSIAKIAVRLRERGSKLIPEDMADRKNWGPRRELAAIFRDFRKHQAIRRKSTNGKVYYSGIK